MKNKYISVGLIIFIQFFCVSCKSDKELSLESAIDEFEFDLMMTKDILSSYKQEYSSWYRAPFGRLSNNMQTVIDRENLIHVVSDAFANDTYIPDPNWISKYILKKIQPGSIILIHMPERGVREWNYKAMELTLTGLKNRNFAILSLTEMKLLEDKNN